ncbi:Gfo/Idh/MocA family oxidoreductase [candidate division KSB1 bacterium]|nr:Gfo/Idh/MocA family oxidoreductase [candidate division KSB1 bacterium]
MIKLGIMGMSPGNGHPFSWSAIINGDYNEQAMADCGYAAIPIYLAANRDTVGIPGARVTHVWTQERRISEHIAAAAHIDTVVERAEELIGRVDAVLLARDDPENHVIMSRPFLQAGVPIFIDKPLAENRADLASFAEQNRAGKFLMSCSSMRYAAESRAVKTEFASLGQIELAVAVGKKDWIKYGVHMLEALFALLDDPAVATVQHVGRSKQDCVHIGFADGRTAMIHLFYDIVPTFQISLFGQNGWRLIEYKNWYAMFRDNLIEFIRSVREGRPRLDFGKTHNIIQTLIAARESLEQGGKKITLIKD